MPQSFEDLAIFPGSELELIRQFAKREDIPESKLLFGSGLGFSEPQNNINNAISLRQFDVIYRNVYRLANRPSLGIDLGLALNLSRWGMMASALLSAKTLGHALAIANEFKEILRSRFELDYRVDADMLRINLELRKDMALPVNEVFAYEVFIGSLSTQISQLIGKRFRFHSIRLPYPTPSVTQAYQQVCDDTPSFSASKGELSIPLKAVRKALPMTNRVTSTSVIAQSRDELERIRNARSGDIVFTVRSMLAKSDAEKLSLHDIANQLSMHPRTLRRRLQQENVQFRHLCEQERQQRALSLMTRSELSLQQISHECGFKDTISFHKAFKRWTGETPANYRRGL